MTIAADAMAHVVSRMAPELAVADFRKRRHSFNRVKGDDLVHVVSFQMGPKLPPGATEVPPYRLDLYGKFTINIGVYVPHLALRLGRAPRGAWVNEYNCHLRQRIGQFLTPPVDSWWSLDDPEVAASTASRALRDHGLVWLDRLGTDQEIIEMYDREGRVKVGLGPRAA